MTKKTLKLIALLIVMILTLTGCKLIEVDKGADDDVIVAEYKGGKITKAEALENYNDIVANYEAYGYGSILEDPETVKSIKTEMLDYMVRDLISAEKSKEFGVDTIPEEKRVELVTQATEEYNQLIEMYTPSFAVEGQTEEEQRAAAIAGLEQQMGINEQILQNYALSEFKANLLFDHVTKGVEVNEEDLRAAYDAAVASDEETYTADPTGYESAAVYGENPMWVPEGYRTVKHILLEGDAELEDQLATLEDQLMNAEAEIEARANPETEEDLEPLEGGDGEVLDEDAPEGDSPTDGVEAAAVGGATLDNTGDEPVVEQPDVVAIDVVQPEATEAPVATDAPVDTEEPAEDVAANVDVTDDDTDEGQELLAEEDDEEAEESEEVDLEAMTDEELASYKADLESKIADLKAQIREALNPTIAEIQAKISAGEDFDALIAEYGTDYGMQSEPTMTTGYYVREDSVLWDTAFRDAAMALKNVGDVTEPVDGMSGVHIIRYYSDVPSGPVDYESVKDTLKETALEEKKNTVYDEEVEKWTTEAEMKLYPEKL